MSVNAGNRKYAEKVGAVPVRETGYLRRVAHPHRWLSFAIVSGGLAAWSWARHAFAPDRGETPNGSVSLSRSEGAMPELSATSKSLAPVSYTRDTLPEARAGVSALLARVQSTAQRFREEGETPTTNRDAAVRGRKSDAGKRRIEIADLGKRLIK
jgi:hypothetical protein